VTGELHHPYEVLDVFTDTPMQGNPLAVFVEGEAVPSRLMQRAARELNLSETVFLLPGDDECDAQARIFTPAAELPFAGHPTLGAAIVVGRRHDLGRVRLRTRAGIVPVRLSRDEDGQFAAGEMEQPIPTWEPFGDTGDLLAALGVERTALPVETYTNGPRHVMVALDDAEAVSALAPDMGALAALGEYGINCFALTGPGAVRTRDFAPRLGVPEDPATGSAAGPLAVHLARHARTAFGEWIEIRQGVEIGRPSILRARVDGSGDEIERVVVAGSAVLVARGHFRLQ
jgi:trans-2,3-dihydro-3-hydroxyanthranilate isomerase